MKTYSMKINGQHYDAEILEFGPINAKLKVNGIEFLVEFENDENIHKLQVVLDGRPQTQQTTATPTPTPVTPTPTPAQSTPTPTTTTPTSTIDVKAPMPAVVFSIKVAEGSAVKTGDILLTIEAMKMESEVVAPCDGTVAKILVREKVSVAEGETLVQITT